MPLPAPRATSPIQWERHNVRLPTIGFHLLSRPSSEHSYLSNAIFHSPTRSPTPSAIRGFESIHANYSISSPTSAAHILRPASSTSCPGSIDCLRPAH
ncbi:hypothetical protein L3Y34_000370 [Caenorhabditis briggsae]|uniref:Uncharacterized protein n=1 Tax=Caenorhabditis briggsae TaxID=6238 RepID=A0AAE9ILU2_CAEBR|nr:hypothetical protein L3Y34_000370 [Caenorhabditis briggsae]